MNTLFLKNYEKYIQTLKSKTKQKYKLIIDFTIFSKRTRLVKTVRFDCTVLFVHIKHFTLQNTHLQLHLYDLTVQSE